VNGSESSWRLRDLWLPDTMTETDGNEGSAETDPYWSSAVAGSAHTFPAGTPRPRSLEGPPPSCSAIVRNVGPPLESDPGQ
jgi:hypothetical protein